jgi:hypothetical protein
MPPSPPRRLLEIQLRRPPGPTPQGLRSSSRSSGLFLAPAQRRLFWPAPVALNEDSFLLDMGHTPEPLVHSPFLMMRDKSSLLCSLNFKKMFRFSTLLLSGPQTTTRLRVDWTHPADLGGLNVSTVIYYLAKAARANPALSIEINQPCLRGCQRASRTSERTSVISTDL